MIIEEISAVGLRGATPEGGWSEELKEEDCIHTLIFVDTDEGVRGCGSVFTNDGLVLAALEVLRPLVIGQTAIEPEAGERAVAPEYVLDGARGQRYAHDQRNRHRPVGHTGQGYRAAGWAALGRTLPRASAPLCFAAHGPAGAAAGRATTMERAGAFAHSRWAGDPLAA